MLYVAPRIVPRLWDAATISLGDAKKAQKPVVQELMPETYSTFMKGVYKAAQLEDDRPTKAWTRVAEAYLPGVVTSWKDTNARPVAEDPFVAVYTAMTYGGATMYKVNGDRMLQDMAYDHTDVLKLNRNRIRDLTADHPNYDADFLLERMGDLKVAEEESFDKLHEVYEGMRANGKTPREMSVMLKGMSVDAKIIRDLSKGEFQFRSISEKSIQAAQKKDLDKLKGEEKKEAARKWKEYKAMLKISQEQLEDEQ
jgi:hypothetical protein